MNSEEKYRYMIENAADGITLADIDGTIRYISPSVEDILGYSTENYIGDSVFSYIHRDDLADIHEVYRRLLAYPDQLVRTEYRHQHKDGSWHLLESTHKGIVEGGLVTGLVVNFRDVTERKSIEDTLRKQALIFNHLHDGIIVTDISGCIVDWNSGSEQLFGYSKEEALGNPPSFLHKAEDVAVLTKKIIQKVNSDGVWSGEIRIVRKDGSEGVCETVVAMLFDDHDKPCGTVGVNRDISKFKLAEHTLKISEDRFLRIMENAADVVAIMDLDGVILYESASLEAMIGYKPEEYIGRTVFPDIHPDDLPAVQLAYQHIKEDSSTVDRLTYRHRHKNGSWRVLESVRKGIFEDGQLSGIIANIRDITDRKLAEEAASQEKEHALVTLRSIGDGVITTNANSQVQYLNPVAEELTGWSCSEAKGRAIKEVFQPLNEQTQEPLLNPILRCQSEEVTVPIEIGTKLISRDGQEYSIEESVSPLCDAANKLLGAVIVFKDATAFRALTQRLSHQASHDTLTGLANRREFEHQLKNLLQTVQNEPLEHAMCYLDLDQFKVINDTCGHIAGDELLRQLGRSLKTQVSQFDLLARLGGDEFGLLITDSSLEDAEEVANTLLTAINKHQFVWQGMKFNVGVSMGLVPIHRHSGTLSTIMSAADSACYEAKAKGGNRVQSYQEDDTELVKRQSEMQWVNKIQKAFEENRFRLFYQKIAPINKKVNDRYHYELLIRMEDEEGCIVMPDTFLPAAERYGLASQIDKWVIQNAFEWLNNHPRHVDKLYLCEINLSGQSIGDKDFLTFLLNEIKGVSIPPHKICFEVTETSATANLAIATHFINTLKKVGYRFALDDFGTGWSSFTYLKNLPVDYLKIDGIFVKDIVNDPIDLAMVKSINDISHVMGKLTIAEHVESAEILETLKSLQIDVDYAQGNFIGSPQPITDLE